MPDMYFGAVPLTEDHIDHLAWQLREGDVVECHLAGQTPREALEQGMNSEGEAYCVLYQDVPIGAIGYTQEGAVWSLWTELNAITSRLILRVTPKWFRKFAEEAEKRDIILCNYVWDKNLPALKWLQASRAVDFREDLSEVKDGKRLVPFVVRPSMEIR